MATATAKVGVTITTEDGKVVDIMEGDVITGLKFKLPTGDTETLDGSMRVLVAATTSYTKGPADCPPNPYVSQFIAPQRIVLDSSEPFDAIIRQIDIKSIVTIGDVKPAGYNPNDVVVGIGPSYRPLEDVLAEVAPGATVKLEAGTYDVPMNLNKAIRIVGSGPDTILTGAITVNVGNEDSVAIRNLTLTGDALVKVNSGYGFEMSNCVFGGHNITTKTMPVAISNADPMLVTISDNTFKAEPTGSYNLIDVYAKLIDGSTISYNTFETGCCAHNQISLYGIDDGAKVYINNNYAAESKNLVRIGFKGAPEGTVMFADNRYDSTDSDELWQGLFLVQPYGHETSSFAKLNIMISGTVYPAGTQLCYLYAGGNDTKFSDDNKPSATLDGAPYEIVDNSPEAVQARIDAEAAASQSDPEPDPVPQDDDDISG